MKPAMKRSNVVLPQPLRPSTVSSSPRAMVSERSSSTVREPKRTVRCSISTPAAPPAAQAAGISRPAAPANDDAATAAVAARVAALCAVLSVVTGYLLQTSSLYAANATGPGFRTWQQRCGASGLEVHAKLTRTSHKAHTKPRAKPHMKLA
jgi:hypothetical protein